MRIKWKGIYSKKINLNGGGPQGSLFGNLTNLAQSNESADMINIKDRFKFVDDLTLFEIVNLLITEIATFRHSTTQQVYGKREARIQQKSQSD